jgi:hypothetical protein
MSGRIPELRIFDDLAEREEGYPTASPACASTIPDGVCGVAARRRAHASLPIQDRARSSQFGSATRRSIANQE